MVEPKVIVDFDAEDQLGVLVRRIVVESETRGDLRKQAHAVVETLTYLGSELKVLEVDGTQHAVLIRSRKPDEGYIEIILRKGTELTLERKPGPLPLSRRDYERLIADLKQIMQV